MFVIIKKGGSKNDGAQHVPYEFMIYYSYLCLHIVHNLQNYGDKLDKNFHNKIRPSFGIEYIGACVFGSAGGRFSYEGWLFLSIPMLDNNQQGSLGQASLSNKFSDSGDI